MTNSFEEIEQLTSHECPRRADQIDKLGFDRNTIRARSISESSTIIYVGIMGDIAESSVDVLSATCRPSDCVNDDND